MINRDHSEFETWLREQTRKLAEPDVTPAFLAAQRRSIYRKLGESPRRASTRWVLSFALLLLIAAGGVTTLHLRHSAAPAPAALSAPADDQLFSDLAALDQSN